MSGGGLGIGEIWVSVWGAKLPECSYTSQGELHAGLGGVVLEEGGLPPPTLPPSLETYLTSSRFCDSKFSFPPLPPAAWGGRLFHHLWFILTGVYLCDDGLGGMYKPVCEAKYANRRVQMYRVDV